MSTVYIDRHFHGVQTLATTEGEALNCFARKTLTGTIIYVYDDTNDDGACMCCTFYLPHTQLTLTLGPITYYVYG